MIRLTRLDGAEFVANSELIETIEATPDTVITMTTGRRLIVRESTDEVVSRVVAFRRRVVRPLVISRLKTRGAGTNEDR